MSVTMQYLSWASFVFEANGRRVLVDPYLAGYPDAGAPASPVPREDMYPLDAILVTHAAADHFGDAVALMKECDAILCGGIDVRLKALEGGIPEERTAILVSGSTYEGDGWSVKALDARHISFSMIGGAYVTGQPLSYVIDFGDVRVFHGGDTSITLDMELYGRLYRPHVALVGVDGVLLGGRPITEMSPREAALAVDMLGASVAVPMHYRDDSQQAERFLEALGELAPHARGLKLEPGETLELSQAVGSAA